MPRHSRPKSRNMPQPRTQPTTPSVNVKGPGIADSIKTGLGFGLGSAVAHSTVDAILGTNKRNAPSQEEPKMQQSYSDTNMCGQIFMKYIDCVQKYDKYNSTCSDINDFLEQMKCKNQHQQI